MNICIGVMVNNRNGAYKLIEGRNVNEVEVNLGDGEWDVGIDQSSSCTGITFMRTDGSMMGVCDIHRDKNLESKVFYADLKKFLNRLLSNRNIRMVIYEKPVPNPKFKNAQKVLNELKGRLEEWLLEIPGLENTLQDSIYPQTWKSLVMDKSKGKNRSNNKKEIARDLVDIYPGMRQYFIEYPFTDYDGFDSLGILTGFKRYAFNAAGIEQIHGTAEKRHTAEVFYTVQDKSTKFADVWKNALGENWDITNFKDYRFLAFNLNYDLNTNVRVASSNSYPVLTLLPSTTYKYLKWEFGIEPKANENVFAIIFKKSNITNNELWWLQKVLPMNKEVFGD